MARSRKLSQSLAFGFAATLLVSAGASLVVTGCSDEPNAAQITGVIIPDLDAYVTHVDGYLNRRCGSLDCHGQPGRAYRIYSSRGFRLPSLFDGGLISGEQATDPAERLANFQALVAVEPENLTRFMAKNAQDDNEAPKNLFFLRKALKLERHKGGTAMAEGDPGWRCVVGWLRIPVVRGDGTPIPPDQRPKLSQDVIDQCEIAASLP